MDFGRMLFGWDWKIRKIRKKWDDLREGSLKKKGRLKTLLLEKLDRTEENLRFLEEKKLGRWDKARYAKDVEIDLEEIKSIKDAKPEELEDRLTPKEK